MRQPSDPANEGNKPSKPAAAGGAQEHAARDGRLGASSSEHSPLKEPTPMTWSRQLALASAVLVLGLLAMGPGPKLLSSAFGGPDAQMEAAQQGGRGRPEGRSGKRPAPSVVLATASEAQDGLTLRLTGGAVAKRSAELKPRASGRVTEVLFTAGDALQAGQAALKLENRREQLALERAEVSLKEALRRRDRARRLSTSGSGSEAALDAAETEAEIARIARDEAEEALTDRTVLAPFDGVASLPAVDVGDRIEPSAVIASVDDRTALLVEVGAPETAFGRLQIGAPVTAQTAAFLGESFQGRIAELDSRVDPQTRTVTLRAEIPNLADRLRPGMSFTLTFDLPGQPAVAVPELALQWERKGAFVWRVRDGRAERTPVLLAARQDGAALLRLQAGDEALRPGDQVVVEGVQRLKNGGRVKIVGEEDPERPRHKGVKNQSEAQGGLRGEDKALKTAKRQP